MGRAAEVLIELDRTSAAPLRAQVEDHVRTAIREGRLRAGDRLPSSRMLAGDLGLSRGVVQECYAQLQAEGYLTSQTGSATRVAETVSGPRARPAAGGATAERRTLVADFASGVPDLASAPRADWAWAIREVCRDAPNSAFDYGDPRGEGRLREVLAGYLRRVRAVDADAHQLLACTGTAQGLCRGAAGPRPGPRRRGRVRGPGADRHRHRSGAISW